MAGNAGPDRCEGWLAPDVENVGWIIIIVTPDSPRLGREPDASSAHAHKHAKTKTTTSLIK